MKNEECRIAESLRSVICIFNRIIDPATKLVIPRQTRHRNLRPAAAKRRAGIQTRSWNYWIPAFAGMTG